MASKMHLCYSNLVLTNLERSGEVIIFKVIANSPYVPKLGSLYHPHGLQEALLVHPSGPDKLGEVRKPH